MRLQFGDGSIAGLNRFLRGLSLGLRKGRFGLRRVKLVVERADFRFVLNRLCPRGRQFCLGGVDLRAETLRTRCSCSAASLFALS
ncbi:MAG: hypothetical protein HC853_10165, partial [Anaerolineae bacterium]|nr:hypothetical protein [Anaerolineae bacterium]